MNDKQVRIIAELTRADAINLYNAGEVRTWRAICETIREVARAGEGVTFPLNVLQFYYAIDFCGYTKRHIIT